MVALILETHAPNHAAVKFVVSFYRIRCAYVHHSHNNHLNSAFFFCVAFASNFEMKIPLVRYKKSKTCIHIFFVCQILCECWASGANSTPAPPVTVTSSIASTALEKKMMEQMTKGSVVIDSTPTNSTNATDTTLLPASVIIPSESVIQKSPPKVNNNA